jgi:hypothetical protein
MIDILECFMHRERVAGLRRAKFYWNRPLVNAGIVQRRYGFSMKKNQWIGGRA